jgi:hypothetical protein
MATAKNWIWPKIESTGEAERIMRSAGHLALLQSGVTFALAATAIYVGHPILGIDRWSIADSILLAVGSWRLAKCSLTWAIIAAVYEAFNIAMTFADHPSVPFVGIVIFLAYIAAVRAAFHLRRNRAKPTDIPNDRVMPNPHDQSGLREG